MKPINVTPKDYVSTHARPEAVEVKPLAFTPDDPASVPFIPDTAVDQHFLMTGQRQDGPIQIGVCVRENGIVVLWCEGHEIRLHLHNGPKVKGLRRFISLDHWNAEKNPQFMREGGDQ